MPRTTGITKNVGKNGTTWTDRWKEPVGKDALGLTIWQDRRATFPTQKAALDHRANRRLGLVAPIASTETMAAYMARWLDRYRRAVQTPATGHRRAVSWRVWGLPHLGHLRLADVTPDDCDALYRAMAAADRAPGTVREVHVLLSMALEAAVAEGLLPRNPAKRAHPPPRPKTIPRHWTSAELLRFEQATAADRDAPLWTVLLRTGMRLGEILALRWSAVDLDRERLRVIATTSEDAAGRLVVRAGAKTDASNRTVPLTAPVVAALRQQRQATRLAQLKTAGWRDEGFVFPGRAGGRRNPGAIRRRLRQLCAGLDLLPLTPHGCRHTAATVALEAGVPMRLVQEMLGHGSITVTSDLYSHVDEGLARQGAETVAAYLAGRRGPGS